SVAGPEHDVGAVASDDIQVAVMVEITEARSRAVTKWHVAAEAASAIAQRNFDDVVARTHHVEPAVVVDIANVNGAVDSEAARTREGRRGAHGVGDLHVHGGGVRSAMT